MPEQDIVEEDYQWFPFEYSLGPESFTGSDGAPTGLVGSEARLTRPISNFPFIWKGVRVWNTFPMNPQWDVTAIAMFEAVKKWVDPEQSIKIELTQQNVLSDPILQPLVVGQGGGYWAPFVAPFVMAGGNNIDIVIRRATSYPTIGGDAITPQVHVAAVGMTGRKKDSRSQPPTRFGPQ
jgi:hypothetical protein